MMLLTTLLASGAFATPLLRIRESKCNQPPTGPTYFGPISLPDVVTAELCHNECETVADCQSFVFGFPPYADKPRCMLFAQPGWRVPSQGSDLNVFDKDCSDVPTGKATRAHPIGDNQGPRGDEQQDQYGDKPNHDGNKQEHDGDNSSPTPPQSSSSPAQSSSSPFQSSSSPQQGRHQQRDAIHTCGRAPTGPAGNTPAPLNTDNNVASETECLMLCKKTTGCKA